MRATPIIIALSLVTAAAAAPSMAAKPPKPPTAGVPKPPTAGALTVSIAVAPNRLTFGTRATVSGKLSKATGGVLVTLQALAFPFGGAFKDVASKPTAANGGYAFTVAPDRGTRYRVVAKASPPVTSAIAAVAVAWQVGFKTSTSTPRRGSRVRFSGAVHPAHPGGTVLVQKLGSSGWKTVTRTTLRAATATYSTYSLRVRVGASARYRVRIPGDGARVAGTSRARALTVG